MSLFIRYGEKRLDTTTEKVENLMVIACAPAFYLSINIHMGSSFRLTGLGTVAGEKRKFLARWIDFKKSFVRLWRGKKTTSRTFDLSRLCRPKKLVPLAKKLMRLTWGKSTRWHACFFIFGSVQMKIGDYFASICLYLSFTFSFSFSGRGIWWCQTLSHHVLKRLTLALVVISLLLQRVHKWFYLGWRLKKKE